MSISPLDNFYNDQSEPLRSCLMAMKNIVMNFDENITQHWKYKLPYFTYKNDGICYFWIHKKFKKRYIGFIDGNKIHSPNLLAENRSRMKIFLIDANEDLPIDEIKALLTEAIKLKKS